MGRKKTVLEIKKFMPNWDLKTPIDYWSVSDSEKNLVIQMKSDAKEISAILEAGSKNKIFDEVIINVAYFRIKDRDFVTDHHTITFKQAYIWTWQIREHLEVSFSYKNADTSIISLPEIFVGFFK